MNRSITLLAIILGLGFAACTEDFSTAVATDQVRNAGSAKVVADAHPAFVYTYSDRVWQRGAWVGISSVGVSDSDATDGATIFTSSSSTVTNASATWSASGSSVSFIEKPVGNAWGAYAIKAVDVSVSTKHVAVGSNARTIYSSATSDSLKILGQASCPASGVNKIAFIGYRPGEWGVYTVSTSGGSATKIYSVNTSSGYFDAPYAITWRSDGSELAFVEVSSSSSSSIKVISSTGTINATLLSGLYQDIDWIQWSNSGTNTIAFNAVPTGTAGGGRYGTNYGYNLYTVGTSAGSTATLLVAGLTSASLIESLHNAYWSPNNSELIYTHVGIIYNADGSSAAGSSTYKVVVGSGAVSGVGQITYGDWK